MEHQYLAHLQTYLRHAASRVRDTQRIGPFLATFTPHDANPFLNYAIPDEAALPSPATITEFITAFRQRARTPRLEYIPTLAQDVQSAMLGAGFVVEGRMPLMICPADGLRPVTVPEGIELIFPTSDADLLALVSAQNEAYGEAPPDLDAIVHRRAFLDAGGIAILARDLTTGEAAGGGICDVPFMQTTELASVGVRAAYRRRGIAAALTAQLAQVAFDADVTTIFLMAAHETEARIYARVGFIPIGEVLALTLPAM